MPEMREVLSNRGCKPETHTYLADGVYCGYDGYQIWLATFQPTSGFHEIALDEDALAALYRYAQQFIKEPSA